MLEYRTIMTQRKYLDLVKELEVLRRRASADGLVAERERRGPGPTRLGARLPLNWCWRRRPSPNYLDAWPRT